MRPLLLIILFGIICGECFATNGQSDTSDFVLVKENDGIALYERWYPTDVDDQLAREVKATFTLKAPLGRAVDLIRDESQGTRWNKNTSVYRIVPRNDDVWFGYVQYDLPWPVSDQDCVLYFQRTLSRNSIQIEFKGAEHPSFPVRKKIQRIPEIAGKWVFKENETEVAVEYYVTTLPSSTLPTWLTDPIIRNNLLETLGSFREILECR